MLDGDSRAVRPKQERLGSLSPVQQHRLHGLLVLPEETLPQDAVNTLVMQRLPHNVRCLYVYVSVTPRTCEFHKGTCHVLTFSEVL